MTVNDELLEGRRPEPIPVELATGDGLPPGELRIDIELLGDAMLIMAVAGEVDCLTQPALESALSALNLRRADTLILDLRGIGFLTARGAWALADAARRALVHDVELRVLPSPVVRRVSDLLGLGPRFLPPR